MKCPACTTADLVMTERASVEVDYCPKCRGVWLDRGELDKIIQRSLAEEGAAPPAPPPGRAPQYQAPPQQPMPQPQHPMPPAYPPGYNPKEDSKYGYRYQQPGQPYRKKSVWRELFDF